MNLYELTHACSWIKSIARINKEMVKKQKNRVKTIKYAGVHNPEVCILEMEALGLTEKVQPQRIVNGFSMDNI